MKDIEGYENYTIYEDGRVYSRPANKFIRPYNNGLGYLAVKIKDNFGNRKQKYIHRLLAESFLDNPNNYPDVNHIDGNKKNNSIENLEWISHKDNLKHAFKLGLLKGANNINLGYQRLIAD